MWLSEQDSLIEEMIVMGTKSKEDQRSSVRSVSLRSDEPDAGMYTVSGNWIVAAGFPPPYGRHGGWDA